MGKAVAACCGLHCLYDWASQAHMPLSKIMELTEADPNIVSAYLRYKEYVSRTSYDNLEEWHATRDVLEQQWPTYANDTTLVSKPWYLSDEKSGKDDWDGAYAADVQAVQARKQNHVHLPNDQGVRVPLPHCRMKDRPSECKGGFPRCLVQRCAVVCRKIAELVGLAITGRRNQLGTLLGARNDEWLNGSHPAMLAALRCNSDVQVPYRFAITESIHKDINGCDGDCIDEANLDETVDAIQASQDAQIGYCCDYANKRGPVACNECREWIRGQRVLGAQLEGAKSSYIAARHAKRIMSDAYGRGVVRGAVEAMSLLTQGKCNAVTAAETIKTALTDSLYGSQLLDLVEYANRLKSEAGGRRVRVGRIPRKKKLVLKDFEHMYGHRGDDPRVKFYSPYEFMRFVEIVQVDVPTTVGACESQACRVNVTETGRTKLVESSRTGEAANLEGGVDYDIKEGGDEWVTFPSTQYTELWRHDWVMMQRRRPVVPTFAGSPLPRAGIGSAERNACIVLTYFHAWQLSKPEAMWNDVPFVGQLRKGHETWSAALSAWINGSVPSESTARYVHNFLCMTRARPRDNDDVGNSDDMVSDEELFVSSDRLAEALHTAVGGKQGLPEDPSQSCTGAGPSHFANSTDAITRAHDMWPLQEVSSRSREHKPMVRDVKALRKSLRSAGSKSDKLAGEKVDASVIADRLLSPQELLEWVERKRNEVSPETRQPLLNPEQYAFVKQVADRLVVELEEERSGCVGRSEPMRWLLHGRPGVGKSHTLKVIRELFDEARRYELGNEYHVGALQAVTATLLGGDTLHHIMGIGKYGRGGTDTHEAPKEKIAKKWLQTRWLVIDEVSMLSAKFLAEIDCRLRSLIRERGTYKIDSSGHERPLAGLNVIFAGDFWQLDPPEKGGVSLSRIPGELYGQTSKRPGRPSVEYGLSLFWDFQADVSKRGVQGVTVLHRPERCKDWWC